MTIPLVRRHGHAPGQCRGITPTLVAGTPARSFPYVRVFRSLEGWGYHFLASETPFDVPDVQGMIARMPEAAKPDLVEWSRESSIQNVVESIVEKEIGLSDTLGPDGRLAISDDRPFNEYYVLRRHFPLWNGSYRIAK